jgi:acylphosphatase
MNEARLWASVTGRVQGVGFRYFVLERARALSLTGYVRNEYDGSVEIVAEGPRMSLERFVDQLREGPRSASVKAVATDWSEPRSEFSEFGVRF